MILAVIFLAVCVGLIVEAVLLAAAQHRRLLVERAYWARQTRPVDLYDWAKELDL